MYVVEILFDYLTFVCLNDKRPKGGGDTKIHAYMKLLLFLMIFLYRHSSSSSFLRVHTYVSAKKPIDLKYAYTSISMAEKNLINCDFTSILRACRSSNNNNNPEMKYV